MGNNKSSPRLESPNGLVPKAHLHNLQTWYLADKGQLGVLPTPSSTTEPLHREFVRLLLFQSATSDKDKLQRVFQVVEDLNYGTTVQAQQHLFRLFNHESFFRSLVWLGLALGGHTDEPGAARAGALLNTSIRRFLATLPNGRVDVTKAGSTAAVTWNDFKRWLNSQAPSLPLVLADFTTALCLFDGNGAFAASPSPRYVLPAPRPCDGETCGMLTPVERFTLGATSTILRREWFPLYLSAVHGMSFATLAGRVEYYPAPTLFIIRDEQGSVFGAMTTGGWRIDSKFYGEKGGFLFTLRPHFQVFHSRDSSASGATNYQYLNVVGKTLLHGIGFGGTLERPRLFLDSELENCRAATIDLTYQMGELRAPTEATGDAIVDQDVFKPAAVEVWGLGDEQAVIEQQKSRVEDNEMAMARRKVDKKQFLESGFDQEFLFSNTFSHNKNKEER